MAETEHVYQYKSELLRIVDGDTLDCLIDIGFDVFVKKRIRLFGMDTWESRTRDLEEKAKGLAAKARLKELIYENGDKFSLISHELGKYGRVLGTIMIKDGRSANDILVEEGHGYAYDGGNKEEARARSSAILESKQQSSE